MPRRYSEQELQQVYVDYLIAHLDEIRASLTPAQRRRLPPIISNFLDERVLRFLRSSTVGDASVVVRR